MKWKHPLFGLGYKETAVSSEGLENSMGTIEISHCDLSSRSRWMSPWKKVEGVSVDQVIVEGKGKG